MSEPCSTPGCNVNPPQLKFYQAFTFATPIIFTLVLLLLFCVLYVRRRQTARAVSQLRAQFFARGIFSAWPIDHGLTKSFRATLPTIVFDEHIAASREDNQCAVCLSDYQFGDKLQQLPLCDHLFHVECIDEWLASNATCPICRTSLLQVGKMVPLDSLNTGAASSQESQGESSSRNAISSSSSSGGGGGGGSGGALAGNVLPPTSSNNNISSSNNINSSNINSNNNGEASKAEAGSEGPSHRSVSSMEDVVKDSAEHIIHIER